MADSSPKEAATTWTQLDQNALAWYLARKADAEITTAEIESAPHDAWIFAREILRLRAELADAKQVAKYESDVAGDALNELNRLRSPAGTAPGWLDANCPECGTGNSIAVASALPWLCGACGRSLIAPLAGRPSGTGSAMPMQPTLIDQHGTRRFRANAIVRHLLDAGPFDMNALASVSGNSEVYAGGFPREDWEQFAQLIGYSLGGFSELSYVSDAAYERAEARSPEVEEAGEATRESWAKVEALIAKLPERPAKRVRREMCAPGECAHCDEVYASHPDDTALDPMAKARQTMRKVRRCRDV